MLIFLLQSDWDFLRPEKLLGLQVLERTPAALTLIYLAAFAGIIALLVTAFAGNFRRPRLAFETDLPREVKKKLSSTATNRSLRIWQLVFFALALGVYGFHVYWTYFADENNEQFQALSYKDLRYRRTTQASLRGWMLDRSGRLEDALAYYEIDERGEVVRAYSLPVAMSHLLGTERGSPGLERTLFRKKEDPMPEAWETFWTVRRPEDSERDVKITIDRDLQEYAASQMEGKSGAIVVMNPQNGEVLAIYSNPAFNVNEAQSLDDWLELEGNKREKPLLNRATREFYVPGSTFKTFTMISAFRNGRQNAIFAARPEGFIPFRGSKPILDANGGCEPPYGCRPLPITLAYEASSNQYFAQMAVSLGRQRIAETARALGILPVATPGDAVNAPFFPDLWNTSDPSIAGALAPRQSTIVTGKDISAYDIGLEGMGQGYAGQMTPLEMALIASAPANMDGVLMKPKIELDQPPQAFAKVLSGAQAAQVRQIMGLVTEGPGGTGSRVFSRVRAAGIRTGGKTGTAEKKAPVYDKETGRLKTVTKKRRNEAGELVEYQEPVLYERTDSWYLAIAPLDRPTLAVAVVVEGGGYGATTAAPIAANIVLKANELGLLSPRGRRQR